ncbi:hypothetical protein KIW84_076654 [Lathyrus oleraceus]|uniref:Sugar phosphate transporter domain-containing protein n=1 Tax=Pisum sativum TaxID=3888 RepID=A0A9D4VZT3_PEA|nr:hypothetical protein KIW84_076654 [Pisum sativum]
MTQVMKNSIPWPTIMVVISWYTSNIGVLLMNKYLLTNYGYKYPVFLTMCHMMLCSVFSYVGISVLDIVPLQSVQSKNQLLKICGLSVVFCFSVVCGNVSLNYIPVSFNQAIGATTPFFTAVFAYAVSRKREAWVTYCTLLPVVAGVIIASGRKVEFNEPATLYGTYSNVGVTSCNIVDGGKRDSDHNRACWRGFQNHLVSSFEFISCIFCEPH